MHPQALPLTPKDRKEMNFAMRLSFSVGLFMLIIKIYAYQITRSAAILSDAAESIVHVFAVGFAAYSMWLSLKPPDKNHLYGHEKIGYLSAGFEGGMITIASIYIFYESLHKIIFGISVENVNSGLIYIAITIFINLILGAFLIKKGKKYKSIILEANGKHILTDCWTSLAAIMALVLIKVTHIWLFDPIIALLTATNILWVGLKLMRRSIGGLMDQADQKLHPQILACLQQETFEKNVKFHLLRHRLSGYKIFIEFHLLFPQDIKLSEAHDIASEIESKLQNRLNIPSEIITHFELEGNSEQVHKKYGLISYEASP